MNEAIKAFNFALEELSGQEPAVWGEAKYNLGVALEVRGEHESNLAQLNKALQAYEAALNIFEEGAPMSYVAFKTRKRLEQVRARLQSSEGSGLT
jgi:tetratricopeptide (TPR) repeat protein